MRRFLAACGATKKWNLLLCLAISIALCLAGLSSSAHAAITSAGNVDPSDPASWTSSVDGYVGKTASGSVAVTLSDDDSSLLSYRAYVGYNSGVSGVVSVNGVGATWTNSSFLYIGHTGKGTLSVIRGGVVNGNNSYGYIGYALGSKGAATVTGSGSSWTNNSGLYAGYYGNGTLAVLDHGSVSGTYGYIGYGSNSTGAITVSGTGSTLTNSGGINIGYNGQGTLSITNHGTANSGKGYIACVSGSTGTAYVSGEGSTWTNGGDLIVGYGGVGKLVITDGADVGSGNSYIGYTSGSTGAVAVHGGGSTWASSAGLVVGGSGAGMLSVAAGGTVTAATVTVNSASILAVDVGSGSTLKVGSSGTGGITNNGKIRLLAGAGAAAGTYTPIVSGTWGGSTSGYQAVGGSLNTSTHLLTVSAAGSGSSGLAISLDLQSIQRALITDDATGGTGWTVGASFVAATSSTTISFTATAMDSATLDRLEYSDRSVLSGWTFSTDYAIGSSKPIYLSFLVGDDYDWEDLTVWQCSAGVWTKYAATDLAYDGTYASFTVTQSGGYAITAAIPEPGTLAILAAAFFGLLIHARRNRRRS